MKKTPSIMRFIPFSILLLLLCQACAPKVEKGIDLPSPPLASFTVEELTGEPNTYVVASQSSGFVHFYDFGNGLTSNQAVDTVTYPFEGTYEIDYSVSNAGGMGTSSQTVIVDISIDTPCEGTLALLTGCDDQKSWKLSNDAGAVKVGPVPYSSEWFASTAGSLQDEQYDDRYEFTEDGGFHFLNQGVSINPFQGYIPVTLEAPELNYQLSSGTGTSGEDQIIIPVCWWMGVWDSGPNYDIVELTEDLLIVHSEIRTEDCSVAEGFFTLTFVREQ